MSGDRARQTGLDMVRSLAVVFAFVVAVMLISPARELIFPTGSYAQVVHVVSYADQLRGARTVAPGRIFAPVGLDARWRPTSARVDPGSRPGLVTFHIGFVTPAQQYAALEETTGDPVAFRGTVLGSGARPVGTTSVGGVAWQEWRASDGSFALLRTVRPTTVILTGGAALGELRTLAGTLRLR